MPWQTTLHISELVWRLGTILKRLCLSIMLSGNYSFIYYSYFILIIHPATPMRLFTQFLMMRQILTMRNTKDQINCWMRKNFKTIPRFQIIINLTPKCFILCTHLQDSWPAVSSITLPDIFSSISSDTIIIKIDIQGWECKVYKHKWILIQFNKLCAFC